ncbi:MAG TPA: nucleotidyltransferase domain-containing protein [Candidatus Paceibacterota bacterium]
MEIIEKQKSKLEKVAQKYQLELVLLFGSQVTGKTHKESDYDVAYLGQRKLSFEEQLRLDVDLMPVFGSDRVDIVDIRKANPLLLKQIFANHQILLCKDKKRYYLSKIYAAKKYREALPLFLLEELAVKRFIAKHQYLYD